VTHPVWHRFEVDGETYYWRTYPSEQGVNGGSWEPIENLDVARLPDTPGVGQSFPAGTVVVEQDAIDLVRFVQTKLPTFP
jgi:hypothetical protein